ncbi:hypothetical protein M427DRAFT_61900, partial [Gonapodya prolifera JEL478]
MAYTLTCNSSSSLRTCSSTTFCFSTATRSCRSLSANCACSDPTCRLNAVSTASISATRASRAKIRPEASELSIRSLDSSSESAEALFVAPHRCLPVLQILRLPLCLYEGRPHFIKRLRELQQSLLVLVPSRVQVSAHVEDFPVSIPQLHDQAILLRFHLCLL